MSMRAAKRRFSLLLRLSRSNKMRVKTLLARHSLPPKPLTLSSARCGERLRIVGIVPSSAASLRLQELGLHERVEIQKIVDGSALICAFRGARLAIGRNLGADVLVEGVLP